VSRGRLAGAARCGASSGGFTLVELIVALAIAGFVALAAQQVLATALDARARSRTQRELALSASARRGALEAWLRAATLSVPGAPFIAVRRDEGGSRADELTFAVADAGALYPGPHRIRVWVDRNPAIPPDDGLVVELLPLPAGSAPADTLVLAPAAARLWLRYLDAPGRWVEAWDAEEAGRLPLAIELRIAPVPGLAVPTGEELMFAPDVVSVIAEAGR
jgi:prepilin-type N-terminal cleavage/methylation domain-containing protein